MDKTVDGDTMLKDQQDAYGHAMYDYLHGKRVSEIVERDDGYFDTSIGPQVYFSEYNHWPEHEKEAMAYVKGTVLDMGCGAGRHALYLQEQGFDITGVDVSPLAVEVCKLRGLKKAHILPITKITPEIGTFDTIIMFGNNFGLFGSFKRARWLLRKFKRITSENGRILAETRDPYQTDIPEHLEYQELNRKRGRMPGQLKLRVRYKKYVTPWFDYVIVSKEEMTQIVENTGWKIDQFIEGNLGMYVAVIEKE